MPQLIVSSAEVLKEVSEGPKCAAGQLAQDNCWAYAEQGLAEHKAAGGKHLEGYWHKGFGGIRPEDWEDKAAQLHELEEQERLAQAAKDAVVKAEAALAAYNSSWGYNEEKGAPAEHKAKGRLADYWRKGFKEQEEDYEDEAARLHELEEHVRLGLVAKGALAAAAAAVEAFNASLGYADEGLAEHKDAGGKHLEGYWHKGFGGIRPEDWEDKAAQLHELEEHVRLGVEAKGLLAAAAAAVAKYNESWEYSEDKGAPAEHKAKGHLADYWRKGFKEQEEDYEDEAARLHELEEHVRLGLETKGALAAASAAMAAFTESFGYADKGLAEHKATGGKHLEGYWHKGFGGIRPEDWEDKAAQLHELEEHA